MLNQKNYKNDQLKWFKNIHKLQNDSIFVYMIKKLLWVFAQLKKLIDLI